MKFLIIAVLFLAGCGVDKNGDVVIDPGPPANDVIIIIDQEPEPEWLPCETTGGGFPVICGDPENETDYITIRGGGIT